MLATRQKCSSSPACLRTALFLTCAVNDELIQDARRMDS